MKSFFVFAFLLSFSFSAIAAEEGLPACRAELRDKDKRVVGRIKWNEAVYAGSVRTPSQVILISTSLGKDKVISIWVREKKQAPNGAFSFMELGSGREQYLGFYMADGFSLGITCHWQKN